MDAWRNGGREEGRKGEREEGRKGGRGKGGRQVRGEHGVREGGREKDTMVPRNALCQAWLRIEARQGLSAFTLTVTTAIDKKN